MKKKTISDGWHDIGTSAVYTEGGMILRAMKKDHNGGNVSAAVYRWDERLGCWNNTTPCKYDTFRAGLRNGNYSIQ